MRKRFIPPQYLKNFKVRSRGYLPHWEADDALYSITYRLAGSLPAHAMKSLRSERNRLRSTIADSERELTFVDRLELDRLFAMRLDQRLDQGYGQCHLARPDIVKLVADNLEHHHGGRYRLRAWCVMPNHVHVVMQLFRGSDLGRVLHSWKSFTSKRAAHLLGLGVGESFWQSEYFDRLIRDEDDLRNTMQYVVDNPVKAGLKHHRWVWPKGGR